MSSLYHVESAKPRKACDYVNQTCWHLLICSPDTICTLKQIKHTFLKDRHRLYLKVPSGVINVARLYNSLPIQSDDMQILNQVTSKKLLVPVVLATHGFWEGHDNLLYSVFLRISNRHIILTNRTSSSKQWVKPIQKHPLVLEPHHPVAIAR